MKDFDFWGCGLRVFWRGFNCPQWPYGWHDYGLYAFGAGPIGFMFWRAPAPVADKEVL